MTINSSVQRAHDELLSAMPESASHEDCPLCEKNSGRTEKAKEVVQMPEETKVFSEAQHVALLTSAVERETAGVSTERDELKTEVASLKASNDELSTTKAELENRVDVLESEKSAETVRADAAEQAFEDYKNELAELVAVEARKAERTDAIKAADETLADEYFTDARVQRWAEMADEQFASLVEDLTEAAAKKKIPAATTTKLEGDADENDQKTLRQNARETAAFTGGASPTDSGVSVAGSYLGALGKLPVAATTSN